MKQSYHLMYAALIVLILFPYALLQGDGLEPQNRFEMLRGLVIGGKVPVVGVCATPADYEEATGNAITRFNVAPAVQQESRPERSR